jgi:flagellar motor switch protein FliN/FliY
LLIAVDDALTHPLATSPLGPLSPAKALQPALEAAALALGPVTLGPAEMCDPPAGIEELIRSGGALVPLKFGHTVHAMVGLNIEAVAPPRAERVSGPAFAGGLDLLRGVEMEVSAELGRARMSLDDLLNLGDGAVIELDRAAGAPADLLVNGRLIARGEVVVADENFGLRITEIITDAPNR